MTWFGFLKDKAFSIRIITALLKETGLFMLLKKDQSLLIGRPSSRTILQPLEILTSLWLQ